MWLHSYFQLFSYGEQNVDHSIKMLKFIINAQTAFSNSTVLFKFQREDRNQVHVSSPETLLPSWPSTMHRLYENCMVQSFHGGGQ